MRFWSLVLVFLVFGAEAKVLKLSLVPYQVEGGKTYEQFEAKVRERLDQAREDQVELIVLPELVSFDLLADQENLEALEALKKSAAHFADYQKFLEGYAKEHQVAIMGGSFHRLVGVKMRNTTLFVNGDGKTTLQDKIYVTPWERENGFENGETLQLFQVAEGVLAVILNCHDIEFPELSELLASHRPELILVPSMTDDRFGYERVARTSMARAVEHMSYVVQVGTTSLASAKWHRYFGGAGIHAPQNQKLYRAEAHAAVNNPRRFTKELDFKVLRETREGEREIYPIRDQLSRTVRPVVLKSQE